MGRSRSVPSSRGVEECVPCGQQCCTLQQTTGFTLSQIQAINNGNPLLGFDSQGNPKLFTPTAPSPPPPVPPSQEWVTVYYDPGSVLPNSTVVFRTWTDLYNYAQPIPNPTDIVIVGQNVTITTGGTFDFLEGSRIRGYSRSNAWAANTTTAPNLDMSGAAVIINGVSTFQFLNINVGSSSYFGLGFGTEINIDTVSIAVAGGNFFLNGSTINHGQIFNIYNSVLLPTGRFAIVNSTFAFKIVYNLSNSTSSQSALAPASLGTIPDFNLTGGSLLQMNDDLAPVSAQSWGASGIRVDPFLMVNKTNIPVPAFLTGQSLRDKGGDKEGQIKITRQAWGTVAATSNVSHFMTIPAGYYPVDASIIVKTAFAGPSISAITAQLTFSTNLLTVPVDLTQVGVYPVNLGLLPSVINSGFPYPFSGEPVDIGMTATGANLSVLTAGELDISVTFRPIYQ